MLTCHGEAVPDKSGVKPSAISLPSGAGSIEGLGESFEPQLNTGSSAYGVGIAIPPGRAGLQPKVRLTYNSGLGNSFVGLGWSMQFPSIKRQTDKGFPSYTAADVFVFDGEELVPLSNPEGDWRCENESAFQRFRQIDLNEDFVPEAWEMTERNGTRHIFGQFRGQSNRWSVVEHSNPPATASTPFDRTYCWALNTTIDLHGNRVEYEYLPPSGNPDSSGILYPSRIIYSQLGGNHHEVRFRYEDRLDKFDDYRPTFAVSIGKRLAGIEVHSFYDGADHLVREYALEYNYRPEDGLAAPPGSIDLGVSTLKRVVQRDRSGNPGNYLPPLLFEYSAMDIAAAQLHSIPPPELALGESGGNVQIADVDGDSLPDIIKTADSITGEQIVCLNRGEFSSSPGAGIELHFSQATIVVPFSSNFRLSDVNSTLMDIDGDGLTDFVRIDPGDITGKQVYTFHNNARLDGRGALGFATTPDIQFSAPPEIAFNNSAVRQMDVNFDKQSDFVLIRPDLISSFYYYFRDRDSGDWNQLGPVFFNPDMTSFAITFDANGESNPHVHLADMNGDRLLDLVYLDVSGSGIGATLTVRYWPYCSLGQWGAMREMTLTANDNFQIDALDLRDVLVQDLTGDGLADIAIIRSDGGGSSTMDLRVNIAGRRWSAPFTRGGLPRHLPRDLSSPTTFRQADLNASGSTDLIWRNQVIGDDSFQWLELMPNGKPNLLVGIDNSLGKRTEITYGNAVDDMIRAREAGYPWQTWCPFPMQVVRRIRSTCGLDLDGVPDALGVTTDHYVSEFRYRDAFYDGFEREFRGFAFAERIDYGDDFLMETNLTVMVRAPGWDPAKTPTGQVSGPTLVTRFRYLTGAADGLDNDQYPLGWPGARPIDEITLRGGREEEILKGRQVWEEKLDPWVLHDPAGTGNFDRGCWLVLNSTNALERTRMSPDDYVYSRIRQEWTVRRLYRPNDPSLSPPGRFSKSSPSVGVLNGLGGSGRSVSFAFVAAVTNEIIEANGVLHTALAYPLRNPIVTAKSSDFDDYGNQTIQRDYGVVSDGSYDDERFTITDFALAGEALTRWIIDKPSRVRTTDENGLFVAETRNFYDGTPFQGLGLGSVGVRALLHRVEQVVTDNAALPPISAQSDRPGDPRLPAGSILQKARSQFDAYGNSIIMLDPLGNPANVAAGHSRTIDYDPAFRTYPIRETIVIGGTNPDLVINAGYDLSFGVITNSTDFNGNVTSYHYDSFARLVAVVKPYDSSAFPTASYEYSPADPNRSRVYTYDRAGNLTVGSSGGLRASSRVISRLRENSGQPGTHVIVSYSDGSGRKLAEVKESAAAGQWIVSAAQSYNRRMTAQAEWLPYDVAAGTDDSAPPHFGQLWPAGRPPATSLDSYPTVKTDKRYDATGREIITINPPETLAAIANDPSRSRLLTQNLPLEKRLFDENDSNPASTNANTPMVHFSDGLGRLIRVHEVVRLTDDGSPGGTLTEWPSRYRYDLNDKLVHIRDSQDNEKWFRYDGLGRKIFMNDPDRGVMYWTYDDASNLRETVDAKAQVIRYTYDGVNRLLTEDYKDEGQPFSANFDFNISQPLSVSNRSDVAYFYDVPVTSLEIGNGTVATAQQTKGFLAYVWDLSGEEHTSYDARGRVTYVVKRIKDPLHGQLVSFRTGFAYDSLDRVTQLTYPDDDFVFYRYNARNLLAGISGGQIITALGTSNVIADIDYRPSGQLAQIDYGNGVRTSYAYDPRLRLNSLLTISQPATLNSQLINFAYEFDAVSNIKSITDNRPLSVVPAGDKRRNTQLFQYDDLYRITRAQYSFAAPGAITENGIINYRYDRIGNMLEQTSTIADLERGLPVANLGYMDSGGSSGRSNRVGRAISSPPGPHALTTIRNPQSAVRNYPYDSNGNMVAIDGLTNTWDFKDRLVRAENAEMTADYVYDYADRRVTKRVVPKSGAVVPPAGYGDDPTAVSGITLYIDKYSEVRPSEVATKYIWNGDTRVARLTAQLSAGPRVRRLHYARGWNLLAPALDGAKLPSNPNFLFMARWNPPGNDWQTVTTSDTLSAQVVLWLLADGDGTLALGGTPVFTGSRLANGPGFLSGWGFEAMPLATNLPTGIEAWVWNSVAQTWRSRVFGGSATRSDLPDTLDSGQAIFVRANSPTVIPGTRSNTSIFFYFQDHITSSAIVCDVNGQVVQEMSYYPYGHVRNENRPEPFNEPYQFAQKELDCETRYYYLRARFMCPLLARFCSADPSLNDLTVLGGVGGRNTTTNQTLTQPQRQNRYSYVESNPLRRVDPSGRNSVESPVTLDTSGPLQPPQCCDVPRELNQGTLSSGQIVPDTNGKERLASEYYAAGGDMNQVLEDLKSITESPMAALFYSAGRQFTDNEQTLHGLIQLGAILGSVLDARGGALEAGQTAHEVSEPPQTTRAEQYQKPSPPSP